MIEVYPVSADGVREPLQLLESFLRNGEPVAHGFVDELRGAVQKGVLEVLAAWMNGEIVGVLVLSVRLNVSIGGRFGSVEELYVLPGARRWGVGQALLKAAGKLCADLGASYVEVEVMDEEVEAFYGEAGFEVEDGVKLMSHSYPVQDRNPRNGSRKMG